MTSIFFVMLRQKCRKASATPFFALIATLVLLGFGPSAIAAEPATLTIESAGGTHAFTVEIMDTPEGREKGLMYRRHLDANAGMLFDFDEPMRALMWMKNTFISLDMLFIRNDGHIANIAENTVPRSTTIISANGKVRYVLEVNAGTAKRLGIKSGDRVVLPKSVR